MIGFLAYLCGCPDITYNLMGHILYVAGKVAIGCNKIENHWFRVILWCGHSLSTSVDVQVLNPKFIYSAHIVLLFMCFDCMTIFIIVFFLGSRTGQISNDLVSGTECRRFNHKQSCHGFCLLWFSLTLQSSCTMLCLHWVEETVALIDLSWIQWH